uniref:Uncharacterized protein n=1 Tax=Oryza meridionalis TaxID=40149 RepID=A0A0E0DBH5_9ORYZ
MGEANRWRCASRDEGCVPLATDVWTPCRSIWRWGSLVGEEGFVSTVNLFSRLPCVTPPIRALLCPYPVVSSRHPWFIPQMKIGTAADPMLALAHSSPPHLAPLPIAPTRPSAVSPPRAISAGRRRTASSGRRSHRRPLSIETSSNRRRAA